MINHDFVAFLDLEDCLEDAVDDFVEEVETFVFFTDETVFDGTIDPLDCDIDLDAFCEGVEGRSIESSEELREVSLSLRSLVLLVSFFSLLN